MMVDAMGQCAPVRYNQIICLSLVIFRAVQGGWSDHFCYPLTELHQRATSYPRQTKCSVRNEAAFDKRQLNARQHEFT